MTIDACSVCGNLDVSYFPPPRIKLFNPSYSHILNLLEESLGSFWGEVEIRALEDKLLLSCQCYAFELYRQKQSESAPKLWPAVGTARTLSPSFSMTEALSLIVSWMNECKSNHVECATGEDANSPLPRRVIAVGRGDGDPYLHETRPNETGQYIALSHCWGLFEYHLLKTLSTNLALRKQAIPMKGLPQTFFDAVELSRALAIDYLWIDSLCIIQYNAADWEREAARMADVYRKAVLTISADAAVDSKAGLFEPVSKREYPAELGPFKSGFSRVASSISPLASFFGIVRLPRAADVKPISSPAHLRPASGVEV
ncbi:heterokaryon incompatibility protein-domain-containing protein [Diplogelasinospora grovesii]|uniref:Heterokaryon incompatibility protein-domain-containing protein n=1 Tax=Diplogelasinospora grovesii TaxID=303347 RepID=A0AAN6S0J7_9PEZI|nr:heterokaryon incompatibility protein-domain-containing protein [Diplogelasinospora grovesii]